MLRDYQTRTLAEVRQTLGKCMKEGKQGKALNTLVYAPTGAGKTVMFAEMAKGAANKGNKILILVDRLVLIPQTLDKLASSGLEISVLHALYSYRSWNLIQLASIDTVSRRVKSGKYQIPHDVRMVIIDECHHSLAPKYNEVFDFCHENNVPVIGFSATPESTQKRRSLLERFTNLVISCSILELQSLGYLCPLIINTQSNPDLAEELTHISTKLGDYSEAPLSKVLQQPKHLEHTVKSWLKEATKADGSLRRTIIFGATIEHCRLLRDSIQTHTTLSVAVVSAEMGHDCRQDLYDKFNHGYYDALISVGVLCEGFDAPSVECVVLARPTKSIIIYIQQIGRGLRIFPGKENCLVLDVAENYFEHGSPLDYIPTELKPAKLMEKGETPLKVCPNCENSINSFAVFCPHCNHSFMKEKTFSEELKPFFTVEEPALKFRNTEPFHTYRGFYQHKLILALNKRYKPEYAVMQHHGKYNVFPDESITRHALFSPQFSYADFVSYFDYLMIVATKHKLTINWVMKWIKVEFGEEVAKVFSKEIKRGTDKLPKEKSKVNTIIPKT